MSDLLEMLEKATGPDQKLDRAIWKKLHKAGLVVQKEFDVGDGDPSYWLEWQDGSKVAFEITTSIDAALALAERVLPGWRNSSIKTSENEYAAYVWERDEAFCTEFKAEGIRGSRALAICIAILKAHEATTNDR